MVHLRRKEALQRPIVCQPNISSLSLAIEVVFRGLLSVAVRGLLHGLAVLTSVAKLLTVHFARHFLLLLLRLLGHHICILVLHHAHVHVTLSHVSIHRLHLLLRRVYRIQHILAVH